MRAHHFATAIILTLCLCSCHKKPEHTADLSLKSVNCYSSDKSSLCAEKDGIGSFEIAEIPEEYRDQFLSECGSNIPCDVVLTADQEEKISRHICKIVRVSWKVVG